MSDPPRSTRAALPAEREHFLGVRGARLFVREIGHGTPLVILHGGPDFDHHYLLPCMDRLANYFRLIYYDQRGRGRSSPGVEARDVRMDSEVDDLDQVRQQVGADRVALLGHSWGGLLAMEYATRHPERVAQLILVNTAPASHRDWMRLREKRTAREGPTLERMQAIAASAEYATGDIAIEAEYYRLHFRSALHRPEDVETVVGSLRIHFTPADILKARAIEERLHAETWKLPAYDLIPALEKLAVPTLVIHGANDLIPVECARNIAQGVPGARFLVLEECGHFAYMERPAEFGEAIARFFGREEAGRPREG